MVAVHVGNTIFTNMYMVGYVKDKSPYKYVVQFLVLAFPVENRDDGWT